ncbi:MAG: peptide ABC transporter substrate-binding protein [Gammaproteobacteria bacterium]|nr:peptide ABC transporter substrate-binding protein [Gammaproteobacteria bacterium]
MRYLPLLLSAPVLFAGAVDAKVLRIGNGGEPETLDPHRYNLRLEETILNDLFLGLTTFDAHGNIVPGAAERWSVSDDGRTWTFELRERGRWSDGQPVTARDFVYAFRRLLDPRTAASLAHFMYPVANAAAVNAGEQPVEAVGVRAPSERSLVVELERPFPFFAERLIYPTGYPVPAHAIERLGDDWVKPGRMVSNGAFVLDDWQPHAHIDLRPNPHFHDADSVTLSGVRYLPTADSYAAFNRYRAGEIDAIGDFPSGEIDWVREHLADHLRLTPLVSIMYLVFNVTKPPFDNPRVREALGIAIDRELLTARVMQSDEVPSPSLVPPMVPGYTSAVTVAEERPTRLERARRLLAEAGYGPGNPLTVTLRYISGVESKRVQVAISAMWKDIGVATTLHHTELKSHFADLRQGDFEVAQAGWFGENNPEHYLNLLVSDTGDVNYGRFASGAFDALMDRAHAEADLERRLELLREAEAIGLAEHPVTPLYAVTIRGLVNPRIGGWHANPRNVHGARYLYWR